jgi:hypothetical protein
MDCGTDRADVPARDCNAHVAALLLTINAQIVPSLLLQTSFMGQ